MADYKEVSELLGKTLVSIKNIDNVMLVMETTDGKKYKLFHYQECCENVMIDDICGDLEDLVGRPILLAEEVNSDDPYMEDKPDSYTWTFYKFATIKGYVNIRWYGESNGNYSEGVDFAEIVDVDDE